MRELTESYLLESGYTHVRQLEDGRWLAVCPMSYGKGRLYFNCDHCGAEACYCYTSVAEACAAMAAFDPAIDEEPQGWFKDPTTQRIRPGGDASKETIGYTKPD